MFQTLCASIPAKMSLKSGRENPQAVKTIVVHQLQQKSTSLKCLTPLLEKIARKKRITSRVFRLCLAIIVLFCQLDQGADIDDHPLQAHLSSLASQEVCSPAVGFSGHPSLSCEEVPFERAAQLASYKMLQVAVKFLITWMIWNIVEHPLTDSPSVGIGGRAAPMLQYVALLTGATRRSNMRSGRPFWILLVYAQIPHHSHFGPSNNCFIDLQKMRLVHFPHVSYLFHCTSNPYLPRYNTSRAVPW